MGKVFCTKERESMKRAIFASTLCATAFILLMLFPSITVAENESGQDCATAQLIALNSSTPGNIDFGGDHDFFKVEVLEAGLLTVWTLNQPAINSHGYLYDSNCSLITENDKRVGNLGFWISHNATPGIYIIAVRHESNSVTDDDYILQVDFTTGAIDDDYGNTCATAEPLALESSESGTINFLGDYDFFKVVVQEPGVLTAGTIDPPGTAIDSQGYLYDSNCLLIAEHDNISAENDNFQISRLVAPGDYFIAVRHYRYNISGSTGSYTLQVEFTPEALADDYGNICPTDEPLDLNTPQSGNLDYGGDYDYFRVEVPEFGLLTAGTISPIDTYGYLYDAGCSLISENDDASDGNLNFQISGYKDTGTYFIAVRHFDNVIGTGSYTIQADFTAGAIPGDINLDVAVDLADLLLILKITTGYMPEDVTVDADVNGDNKIDLRDALYILQIIVGIRP
jgi:hypothetical protein